MRQIYTGVMATSLRKRKKDRSCRALRSKPQDLELINKDGEIMASFEQVGCM
jgi:hypothetical protein